MPKRESAHFQVTDKDHLSDVILSSPNLNGHFLMSMYEGDYKRRRLHVQTQLVNAWGKTGQALFQPPAKVKSYKIFLPWMIGP